MLPDWAWFECCRLQCRTCGSNDLGTTVGVRNFVAGCGRKLPGNFGECGNEIPLREAVLLQYAVVVKLRCAQMCL
jgi:hypothetical protein